MWTMSVIVASAALMLSCSNGEKSATSLRAEGGCIAHDVPALIPDATPDGVRLGPIAAPARAGYLGNVGLYLEINHPNPVDIGVWLCYDADNDGVEETRAEVEFYRGKRNGWDEPEPNACPVELSGHYYFGGNTDNASPFAVFRGLDAGGSFFLAVVDSLAADVGFIHGWTVKDFPVKHSAYELARR